MSARLASHAGSWYTNDAKKLSAQIRTWFEQASSKQVDNLRAIICPHAGYTYCGATAAHSFKSIKPENFNRIFILGPSHHHGTPRCELTAHDVYQTPIADLKIDQKVISDLLQTKLFDLMDEDVDEEEHSIEMMLPFIAEVMKGRNFTIVPILVGYLSQEKQEQYGKALLPYFEDPSNLFVISSDFCHYGARFSFCFDQKQQQQSGQELWEQIKALDQQGVQVISQQNLAAFNQYIKTTKNTICGRYPISILLSMLERSKKQHKIENLAYSQSSKCTSNRDSSVSYAAVRAVLQKENTEEEKGK